MYVGWAIRAMVVLLGSSLLLGGVIPGRWEKVQALAIGTPIVVRLHEGDRVACTFQRLTEHEITVTRYDGVEATFSKSRVRAIQGVEVVADQRWDGPLIGFGIGAGSYLGLHAAACCAPSEAHDAGAALFFGGIGALIGFIADHNVKRPEAIYLAPLK